MDERITLRDCYLYLNSVHSSYPYGIPASSWEVAAESQSEVTQEVQGHSSVIFLADERVIERHTHWSLNKQSGELLTAICEKGMQQKLSEVQLVNLAEDADGIETLRSTLTGASGGSCLVIALGVELRQVLGQPDASSGDWCSWEETSVLITHDLGSIQKDPATKKSFWADLQKANAHLQSDVAKRAVSGAASEKVQR